MRGRGRLGEGEGVTRCAWEGATRLGGGDD